MSRGKRGKRVRAKREGGMGNTPTERQKRGRKKHVCDRKTFHTYTRKEKEFLVQRGEERSHFMQRDGERRSVWRENTNPHKRESNHKVKTLSKYEEKLIA